MAPALPPPPPPAVISPVRQHAPTVAPTTTTTPMSPQQIVSVARFQAALQRDRARPVGGVHFGELQRVRMYRSKGGGKRGRQ